MVDRFSGASNQMGKLIAELQKSVLKMRMVTIDHVFRKFARPMRELAIEHGKELELQISGGETELDRADFDAADAVNFWDRVNRQDWAICENVQRGMRSRVFQYGYYAPMESASRDIRRYVAERLEGEK